MKSFRSFRLTKWTEWEQGISAKQKSTYNKLLSLSKTFNHFGINVFYSTLTRTPSNSNGVYMIDEPWDKLSLKDPDYLSKPYLIIVFKIDNGKFAKLDEVFIQHTLTKKWKPVIDEIMTKNFGKKYSWNGSEHKAIRV